MNSSTIAALALTAFVIVLLWLIGATAVFLYFKWPRYTEFVLEKPPTNTDTDIEHGDQRNFNNNFRTHRYPSHHTHHGIAESRTAAADGVAEASEARYEVETCGGIFDAPRTGRGSGSTGLSGEVSPLSSSPSISPMTTPTIGIQEFRYKDMLEGPTPILYQPFKAHSQSHHTCRLETERTTSPNLPSPSDIQVSNPHPKVEIPRPTFSGGGESRRSSLFREHLDDDEPTYNIDRSAEVFRYQWHLPRQRYIKAGYNNPNKDYTNPRSLWDQLSSSANPSLSTWPERCGLTTSSQLSNPTDSAQTSTKGEEDEHQDPPPSPSSVYSRTEDGELIAVTPPSNSAPQISGPTERRTQTQTACEEPQHGRQCVYCRRNRGIGSDKRNGGLR
ncbi:hypothetical protein K469DRAFT_744876 [Zopfia rhizophila CBS 207.26]|uniref:Uncharacterized protein n=1 Tax=Zopfia rhizophila CBS 207.26 TaxID=1314779 RepID=A0A6A6ETX7_9PEZI|nr:hypothetical protein K469DRAFT_744876 [Zopfia rhizophila CBS 207.26]